MPEPNVIFEELGIEVSEEQLQMFMMAMMSMSLIAQKLTIESMDIEQEMKDFMIEQMETSMEYMKKSMEKKDEGQWGNKMKEAICCMPGMDCWDASYEGAQGREDLMYELEMLRNEYPEAKQYFDELNFENLQKEAAERQLAFGESKKQTRKLTNQVGDAYLKKEKWETELATLDPSTEAHFNLQT